MRSRFLSCAIAAILVVTSGFQSRLSGERPNFLVIVVDDQSPFDLKTYNERSVLETPRIDELAKNGVVVDIARHMGSWSGAVCTPSRHMIMSGRSVWHIPNRGKKLANPNATDPKLVPKDLEQNTLAAVFNRAGYDTMRTCKNGNSYEAANQQFTVRRDATKRGGTDQTGSTWHAEQVLDYLGERQQSGSDKPFMIYFGFSHPHDTRDGKPELLEKYGSTNHKDRETLPQEDPRQPPLPINYLPNHPFDHGHPKLRDEVAVSGVWKNRDRATIRNEWGRQFACSENIDIEIGRVLDRLREDGELDNTYVIYTADHGMAIGRHGLQGKQNLYEHTWRVPLIVQGPDLPRGTRVKGNVYLMDLLATLCDFGGIQAPETNEGLSFRNVLEGKQETVRDVMFGVYCGGTKPGMRCVSKGDWKLIKYDVLDGTVRQTQLFNLKENPHEFLAEHRTLGNQRRVTAPRSSQVDLAEDPRFAEERRELEKLLLEEMRRLHDPYPLWDQPTE